MILYPNHPRNQLVLLWMMITILSLLAAFATIEVSADIITVDDDGDADFVSIQEAIGSSSDGDIIQVQGGMYPGNISISTEIVLEGVGHEPVIVDGFGSRHAIDVLRDNVTISGFTIRNTERGIRITSNMVRITGMYFESNNTYGLEINGSHELEIEGNEFRDCRGFGIRIIVGTDILVRNNHFIENGYGVSCDVVSDSRIEDNLFDSHSIGVYLISSKNVRIEDNEFNNSKTGVFVLSDTCDNIRLKGNDFSGNRWNVREYGKDEDDPMKNPFVIGSVVVIAVMIVAALVILIRSSDTSRSSKIGDIPLHDPVKHEQDGESGDEKTHDAGHDLGALLPPGLGDELGNEEEKPGDMNNCEDGDGQSTGSIPHLR